MRLRRSLTVLSACSAFALGVPTAPTTAAEPPPADATAPDLIGTAISYELSRPAAEVAAGGAVAAPTSSSPPSRSNPLAAEPDGGQRGTGDRARPPADPLAAASAPIGAPMTPAPVTSFDGVGNPLGCGGCSPPDTIGDVGPGHYVQMVNATKVAIYDHGGVLLTPVFSLGSLWSSGVCTGNAGDPVVVYDEAADRWLLSQFAGPSHLCFAISQAGDPTGAYHVYTFDVGSFPDYFKVGVQPSAYFVGANEATYTAYAFDRAKMLVGNPTAGFVKFSGQSNFLLPADVDGQPPLSGVPGTFSTFKDNAFHGGGDRVEVFALDPDFVTPASSTFALSATIPVAAFTYTVCGFFVFSCARQQGTSTRIDVVSEWPMHRLAYRSFGGYEVLLGNFTVGGSINGPGGTGEVGAAIRWFELRRSGASPWTLFQEGTYDPADGHDRFMGSIAMDAGGNIALGYSVSSSAMFPSIRYASRAPGDPLGTLGAEQTLMAGAGAQTGSNRWGDYSAMSVDPSDGCTFWYTNEYYAATSATTWSTRIGAFRPGCPVVPGAPTGVTATVVSATSASVAFTPPTSDGGSPITAYQARCTSSTGGALRTALGPSSPITVGRLTTGARYTCRVRAINVVGPGPFSLRSPRFVPA